MTMFTRRCSRQLITWRSEFASGFKILLMLVLLSSFFISNRAYAQCTSFGIDFKQGANRDNFDSYTTGEIHWIGSILQNSNSRYIEGMSTLQRIVMNNLTPACNGSCVHTLQVKFEASKSGNHAYDFITSWDNAFLASESIAPGFGLMPTSRSDPKLHECGPAIGGCSETACNLITNNGHSGGTFEDIPVIDGETNLIIPGDQNTTIDIIQTYECRYGDRTVRVYVDPGTLCGTPGDANNRVVFAGYGDSDPGDGGTTYIFYDIIWCSCSPNVVIEFGAHIAVGVDGVAATNPGGCNETELGTGYFVGQGASDISGGPYHVIVDGFLGTDGTIGTACEPNLGNLDNQLQGSQVLLIPDCSLSGPGTACPNQTGLTYTATYTNLKDATYAWSIINGTSTGATISSNNATTAGPITVTAGTVGTFTVQLVVTNGGTTQATDDDISHTCTQLVTVTPGATITCPQNTTVASCQTQAQVDALYAAWLATVSATGGTPTNNGGSSGPSACGGSKTVTFTATNTCGNATCSATFTVTNAPAVVLTCAQNTTVGSCLTQAQVDALYTSWLATATASGGCNRGSVTNNGGTAPAACGGSKTVTFTVTSSCEGPKTCSASFAVTNAPAVVLTCAQNTTVASCLTQSQVDALYASWLATATASGGCNRGPVTNNDATAPAACGGSKTVTFSVTSSCEGPKTCSASFTVTNAPAVVLTCAQNTTVGSCLTQAQVDAAYATWLATATATGGCNRGSVTNNGGSAPAACGGSKTVTFTVTSSCESPKTCSASFTVTNAPAVVLTCAVSTTVAAGQTQAAVDAEYAAWLATATASGGCNRGSVTNNGGSAPAACGGSKTVTFSVTSSCEGVKTCSATFTVTAQDQVSLTCPQSTTIAACTSQASIDAQFAAWLASVSSSGGTLTRNPVTPVSPNACSGGTTTVTWTVSNSCFSQTCSASFTVNAAPAVVLTCATNTTVASCQTQAQVDAAYSTWLATATASGGCNRGSVTNNGGSAPSACGGSKTVTFTVTSSCEGPKTCSASFTVTNAPAVVLTCAQSTTVGSCQTQAAVDAAYAAWLATATATGGCNRGSVTNNGGSAPAACGGSKTVTFTVTSSCEGPKTCSASFTVTNAPAVVLTCAQSTTVGSCQTQAAVDAAYAAWLATASASSGCNLGSVTNNGGSAPSACGGSKTVTFTVTSSCEAPKTCSATFTVTNAPAVSLTCPANTTIAANQGQDAVNAAFAAWLASVQASGGCNRGISNDNTGAPDACGGSTTVTFTVTSSCEGNKTCSATFTVAEGCQNTLCTYTQGYYGNTNGNSCDADGTSGTPITYQNPIDLIKALLGVGGVPNPLVIGSGSTTVTIPATATAATLLNASMPGNGTPRELFGSCTVETPVAPCWTAGTNTSTTYINKQGRINNVLLSQTITLGLNLRISTGLSSFTLQAGVINTAQPDGPCGTTTPKTRVCNYNPLAPYNLLSVTNDYTQRTITPDIITALNNKGYPLTVAGLYQLANDALANVDGVVGSEGGATLSSINAAVSAINEVFDKCAIFVGWDVAPCPAIDPNAPAITSISRTNISESASDLSVSAYPNPFKSTVRFTIQSNTSGQASLEVYNAVGQRIGVVYKGLLQANRGQVVDYKAPRLGSNLIYILRVGSKQVTGKLLHIE